MDKELNIDSSTVQPPSSDMPKKKMIRPAFAYLALGVFLAVSCGAVAFEWTHQIRVLTQKNETLRLELSTVTQQLKDLQTQQIPEENTVVDSQYVEPQYITADSVEVEWAPKLTPVDKENCQPDCSGQRFIAGVIKGGKYDGVTLYLEGQDGMGGPYYTPMILENGEKKLVAEAIIKGIGDDVPMNVNFPGTSYQLKKAGNLGLFSDVEKVKKLFTHPQLGDFYLIASGCIVVELPDHTTQSYGIVVPFEDEEKRLLNITFSGGKKNDDIYSFHAYSCGQNCNSFIFVDEKKLDPANRLVIIGKTSNNENIYGIKDQNDPALKAIYENKYTVAYTSEDGTSEPKNKYTYEEFIAYHPLIYWKDPLGRWVEMSNDRFAVAVEMCKPAIYLYPTEKTTLSVKVHPTGGFTYTNPEYGSGWDVEASPEGLIKDLSTHKLYDYLFWEGKSNDYPITSEGWVVAQKDLGMFFDETLKHLGLNAKEIAQFKEYWVRQLNERPYYHISFLTKDEIDQMAPLEIAPIQPDHVIRVMMTAQGVNSSKTITPRELPSAPDRSGFTVVEWGGVLVK